MSNNLLEYRRSHEERVKDMLENISKIENAVDGLPSIEDNSFTIQKNKLSEDISLFKGALKHRLNRVQSPTCRVAVIGLEKQGKSSFVNAWIGQNALPAATERCTWAASTIVNSETYGATITFLTKDKFNSMIKGLCDDCYITNPNVFPFSENFKQSDEAKKVEEKDSYKTLSELSDNYGEIKQYLGNPSVEISENTINDLNEKLYKYISLTNKSGERNPQSYAIERAKIKIPLMENLSFEIDDLPGINAPGNRAEKMTWEAVENYADVIIMVKCAASNASLDRDEENVWEKAQFSDTSIKLTERIFIVLNKADMENVHHGRDCHLTARDKFLEKGVDPKHIFFCSSSAELYDKFNGVGLDFKFDEEDDARAKRNIGKYYGTSNLTTGFAEFKSALYEFIDKDLEVLERRALSDLMSNYKIIKDKVKDLLRMYDDDVSIEKEMTPEEVHRFEELWNPRDAESRGKYGLYNKIKKTINKDAMEAMSSDIATTSIFTSVKQTINNFKIDFIENNVTEEKFEEEGYTDHNSAFQSEEDRNNAFLKRIQELLKKGIYEKLGKETAQNLYSDLEIRWNNALATSDENAPRGLQDIPDENIKSILNTTVAKKTDGILKEFFVSYTDKDSEKTIKSCELGFEAILKSIANSPLEFFFRNDKESTEQTEKLIGKSIIYSTMMSDDGIKNKLTKYIEDSQKDQFDIKKFIDDNTETVIDIVSIFLPKPLQLAVSVAKSKMKKSSYDERTDYRMLLRERNSQKNRTKSELDNQDKKYSVVDDAKERINKFFVLLEAMLFDRDFGFIGFYQSQFEEFRLSLLEQVEDGCIVDIARCFRDIVWPEEQVFKISNLRKEKLAQIAGIKALVMN